MAGHGEVVGHQRNAGSTGNTCSRKRPANAGRFSCKAFARDDTAFTWGARKPRPSRRPRKNRGNLLGKGEA